ncbi:hypothetical protein B0T17DRAFT_537946 [Bombardia bombarda]|uniref:Uncharacterized protein n=1 Tax=Bombardia bombarda TaxID=252184 RepID=A0AA39WN31_9PEZI|nr:hypothetical protein B0T17DRAFT_537946 [Bombardia bombarda]
MRRGDVRGRGREGMATLRGVTLLQFRVYQILGGSCTRCAVTVTHLPTFVWLASHSVDISLISR